METVKEVVAKQSRVDEDPRVNLVPESPGQEFPKPVSAAETCSQARRERKNTRKDSCSTATKVEKKNVRMTRIKLNKDTVTGCVHVDAILFELT